MSCLDGPRQAGDARSLDLAGDRLDRLEVVRRGDREAGLDDVDAQLGELAGDLELLGPVQGRARRLFAVAQRRIEDVDVAVLGHECTHTSQGRSRRHVVCCGSGCDPERGRQARQVSTHPPAGGGAGRGRGGRGRGRVPQCGPPGATRLCCGDAWSGESTSGAREGASVSNQDNVTPVSGRPAGEPSNGTVTTKGDSHDTGNDTTQHGARGHDPPRGGSEAGAFVLRREARPRDRDARRHAGGPLRPRRQGQPDLALRARPHHGREHRADVRGRRPRGDRLRAPLARRRRSRSTTSPASRPSTASRRATSTRPPGSRTARATSSAPTRRSRPRQARSAARERTGTAGRTAARRPGLMRLAECSPATPPARHLLDTSRMTPLVGWPSSVCVHRGVSHVQAPAPASASRPRPRAVRGELSGGARRLRPLWSQPVTAAAQLVAGDAGVTVVWAVADGAGAALVAQRYDRAGEPLGAAPAVLADGIDGLSDWLATGDGAGGVIATWKAGGVTSVQRFAASGVRRLRPRDGLQRRRRGGAARVRRHGGAGAARAGRPRRRLRAASGDAVAALGRHPARLRLSARRSRAPRPRPRRRQSGTVAGMSSDALGHLFVLLSGPGRNGVAVQRFAPDLNADGWAAPISPYNPLVGPPPATPQTPVGIVAASSATTAWREGGKVKVQRFTAAGDRLWLRPAAVSANGATDARRRRLGRLLPRGHVRRRPARAAHRRGRGPRSAIPAAACCASAWPTPAWTTSRRTSAGDLAVAYGDGASLRRRGAHDLSRRVVAPRAEPRAVSTRRPRGRTAPAASTPSARARAPGCGAWAKPAPR